jgi:fibronectin-binding autotransporter adhesin
MKPLLKNSLRLSPSSALQASLLLLVSAMNASAATFTWDGGGTDAKASTAANWSTDIVPPAGQSLVFSGTSAIGTAVTWDLSTGNNPVSLVFDSTSLPYTITGTTTIQLTAQATVLANNSSSNISITNPVHVFFNGTKTFTTGSGANAATLTLNNVVYRSDSMVTAQTNTLALTGVNPGIITGNLSLTGTFPGTATQALSKSGSGTWTINGNSSYTGNTAITAGLLRLNGTNASRAVTISGGALGGTGTFTNTSATVVVSGTGGIDLINGSVGTLTFPSTLGITGAVGANNLRFDLGAGAAGTDKLVVGAETNVNTVGAAVISFNQIGGAATRINAGTYDLIQGNVFMADIGQFALPTTKAYGSTFALGVTGTTLQVTTTQASPGPSQAFWAGGSDAWSSASNWNTDATSATPTGEVPGYQTNVTFNTTTPAAANLTSNLVDTDFDINSLTFNSAVGNTTIGGTGMVTLEANASNGITTSNTSGTNILAARVGLASSQTWNIAATTAAATVPLVVSGAITDFGAGHSLTKTGAGRITLSGANSIAGPLFVNAGTILINRSGATGNNTINIGGSATVASGASLQIQAVSTSGSTSTITAPISVTGNGTLASLEFPSGNNQTIAINGGINVTNGVIIRSFGLVNTYNYGAPISGNATTSGVNFRMEGGNQSSNTHTVNLNAASTYTGNTTFNAISQQTNFKLGVNDALPVSTSLSIIGGGNANTFAVFDLNARSQTLAGLTFTANAGGARVINSSATNGTLILNNPADATFAGSLGVNSTASIANNNVFGFTKAGPSTLTLSAASFYSGATSVSGGVLKIGNANSLGSAGTQLFGTNKANGATTVSLGAALDLNGVSNVNENIILNGTGISSGGALINTSATAASVATGIQSVTLTGPIPVLGIGSGFSNASAVAITGTGTGATPSVAFGLTTASINSITVGGTGYVEGDLVNITGGGGTGAIASVTSVSETGAITGLSITNAGSGYITAPTGMTRRTSFSGTNTTMTLTGNANNFTVTNVGIATAGTGYTGTPVLTIGGVEQPATFQLSSSLALASNSSVGGTGDITINPAVSGAFDLTKVGVNTLTLNGATSYTGATSVLEGTLRLGSPALSDTATLTIGTTVGSTATLNLPNAGTDVVGTLIIDGVTQPNGLYDLNNSGGAITGSGKIQVGAGGDPYSAWATSFGLQNPWLGQDPALNGEPTADPDNDGIVNLLEFTLGGSPIVASTSILPTVSTVGANLVLSYKRSDESETATTQIGQWSSDLVTWNPITPVLVQENDASADDMTVSTPTSNSVGGKLFLRLNVVAP